MPLTTGILIRQAWDAARAHWRTALRVSLVPLLVLPAVFWLESFSANPVVGIVTSFISQLAVATIAVRMHRLILLGEEPPAGNFGFAVGRVEVAYAAWVYLVTDLPILLLDLFLVADPGMANMSGGAVMRATLVFAVLIFFVRNFAVLPAIALGGAPAPAHYAAAFQEASAASRPAWVAVLFAQITFSLGAVLVLLPVWFFPWGNVDWIGKVMTAVVGDVAAVLIATLEAIVVSKAYAALDFGGTSLPRPTLPRSAAGDIEPE